MKKPKKGNWIVRMRVTILEDVYVENCTEEEARNDPYQYESHEQTVEHEDWEVISVTPND